MRTISCFALASSALLSACMTVPSSPTAGPGAADADPAQAARIFHDLCVETLPSFSGTAAAASQYPFTRNSTFGTYYHNTQNLSVKLLGTPPSECSIVFAGSQSANDAFATFAATLDGLSPNRDTPVGIRTSSGPDGKNYINARISSPQ